MNFNAWNGTQKPADNPRYVEFGTLKDTGHNWYSQHASQHDHKKYFKNVKTGAQFGHRSCEIVMKEKTPLTHDIVCFQMLDFETSKFLFKFVENSFFLENYVTSEGAVTHNVIYSINLSPLLITP